MQGKSSHGVYKIHKIWYRGFLGRERISDEFSVCGKK